MSQAAIWNPSSSSIKALNVVKFQSFINKKYSKTIQDYSQLHDFSVNETENFWQSVVEFCGVDFLQAASEVVETIEVCKIGKHKIETEWFIGEKLNYAQNILKYRSDRVAIMFENEKGAKTSITYKELYHRVAKLQLFLKQQNINKGDVVAGFLPNIPETIIAMLATTSLGAIWTSTSPDFGFEGVVDRFGQVEAKIMFVADGYYYNGKTHDCLQKAKSIADKIPSIERIVVINFTQDNIQHKETLDSRLRGNDESCVASFVSWNAALDNNNLSVDFEPVDFKHPLYILYSSGTTGKPKCIVHGHGGILLQHKKELVLHSNVKPDDILFYFTTCGWMMWNWMVSTLTTGVSLYLYDGSPFYPDGNRLLDIVQNNKITHFGTSAKWISAIEKADIKPNENRDFAELTTIFSTGSPLMPENYDYVYSQWKQDVCLSSISGGTDICSCFALGNPALPVYKGELQCLGLGMDVAILDDNGKRLFNEIGELSCMNAFPAMPVMFWNDQGNTKYKAAYFEKFDNIWCHGDLAKITEHAGLTIYGRSDATLNPGGVRIGTAEIYRQVDNMPEVIESIAIGQDWGNDVRVILFVLLKDGLNLDDTLIKKIKTTIRTNTTPRHVPSKVIQVTAIPKTLSGKIVEIAVKNEVHGRAVTNTDALANPESLDLYKNLSELEM
ncbi:MAG: acetoacetate--CoA ligase [Proteobacteria bacterium]|nr:acetoacetate--CoA ligase [Pseudomonadota bacterium]